VTAVVEAYSLERYLALWGAPLEGDDAPCGKDADELCLPEFDRLRVEVGKDGSLHGAATDWKAVADMAALVLSTQSKQVWALAWAVYAEYRLHGFAACPPAFAALVRILEMWWDSLNPPLRRLPRRLAPLAWLCDRMGHQAETTCFMDGSSEAVQELRAVFDRLQAFLRAKAGDSAPNFPGVFNKIPENGQARHVDPSTASPDVGAPQGPGAAPTPGPKPGPVPLGETGGSRLPAHELPRVIRGLTDQTRQLAEYFLALNPTDERAYRLHRLGLWDTLLQSPAVNEHGVAQVGSGVPPDRVTMYRAAVASKQYADILPALERTAARSPFWFEGHAWVARCLEGLNAPDAAAGVGDALGALLRRLPELVGYKFRDETEFAPPAILPWLESLQRPDAAGKAQEPSPAGPAPEEGAPAGEVDGEAARLEQAVEQGMRDGFAAGLRLLGDQPPGRSRPAVRQGLLRARYCLMMGKPKPAAELLAALYERLKQWDLLDWEPDLTAEILSLLLGAQPRQNDDGTKDLVRRLHWANLEAALNLSRKTR
jgi:type VI secretion system protein VasJ